MAEPTIGLPEWAEQDVTDPNTGKPNVQEPTQAKKNAGLAKDDGIPRQHYNWLFRSTYRWLSYLRQQNIDRTGALAAEVTAREEGDDALQSNIAGEATARASADSALSSAILDVPNKVILSGTGVPGYATLADGIADNWAKLNQAIMHAQDFAVEFVNDAEAVVATGTITVYTTLALVRTMVLPPVKVSSTTFLLVRGAGNTSLPDALFPLTQTPPVGSGVSVFKAIIPVIANSSKAITEADFRYTSVGGAFRDILISIPGSGGSSNGWVCTSINFPFLVPNPI